MKKIFGIVKVILGIIIVCIIIVLAYALMDMSNYSNIVSTYNQVGAQRGDNTSGMKKLNFLSTYIKETGDYSFALDKGYGGTPGSTTGTTQDPNASGTQDPSDNGPQVGIASTLTKEAWESALAQCGNDTYFKDGNGYYIYSFNGNAYLRERQTDAYWNKIKSGTGKTVSGAGCFLFATTNAINNLLGEVHSTAEILNVRDSNNNVTWDTSSNKWVSGASSVNIAQRANEAYVFNHFGLNMSTIANDLSLADAANKIKAEGFNDCVYILYCHTARTSGGGCHWQVCVGVNTDNSLNIIDNENAPSPTSTEPDVNTCQGTHKNAEVSVIFKISK